MPLTLHDATVPVFARALRNLGEVLRKGEAHARQNGRAAEELLQARLIDDMLPLLRQVQIATDNAKNGCARLAAVEPPRMADDETTFAELYARLERTIGYIEDLTPQRFEGAEAREIVMPTRSWGELRWSGRDYLAQQLLPNFFFHVATAYAILRANGVPLGKGDYLGLKATSP
ncbi:DUF1993 domain-containing protein [Vulcaniibacterium tengchongense]|uniref:DUF1993 domain-containing protein n=1 Tax=Vulcaniibacterium tengchongense TaxID=1273429 RepID=A0A3N4W0Z1_9GAMM|nr:DUF1993 domain-containing protein [Vulcaniibacterium tengchongense]RPE79700.1 hypothetical protein EDC50_1524 [Vulcaniibacterium tengchongense]